VSGQQIDVRRTIGIGCYLLVGVYLLFALYLLSGLSGPGRYYRTGVPAGSDFLRIWAASSLASQGHPALVYKADELKKVETAVVGGDFSYGVPWHYPPSFLWLMLPISSLNYLAALAVWLFIPLVAFLALLYRIFPDRLTIWLALASIATAQNLFYGQGAFLIGVLLGGGLLLVDRHPFLGGLLFSLLINYKPHLGMLIPLALMAGRRWRALGAFAAASAALVLLSAWFLGADTWLAFGHDLSAARLELGEAALWDRMPTVFGAVRFWGRGAPLAVTMQILTALAAAGGVYWLWRSPASLALRGSVLVLGTLLLTPYAFNYDLTLLLLALAWMAREEADQAWGRGNLFMLGLVWLLPFLNLVSVQLGRIHLAPVILAAWLIYLLTRAIGGMRRAEPITSG
jgi:alpha-1,2-mannosyltransferase